MIVRIAMRSGNNFLYCESTIKRTELGVVLDNLYHNDSVYLVERLIRSGSFGVQGKVLKRSGGTCKLLSSWDVLTCDCVVLFYDKNINHNCSSPYSVYKDSELQGIKVGTYNAERYENQISTLLCA